MDYKISQALTDLKNFYGLEEFKEVNLNMVDVAKPFIKFKSGDENSVRIRGGIKNNKKNLDLFIVTKVILDNERQGEII